MPTDPPEGADPPNEDPPPTPPAPAGPASPSKDEVKGWVKEALGELLAGGGSPPDAPDLSTDKKTEEYVEGLVRTAMESIKAEELAAGNPPAPPGPDPTPKPEGEPESGEGWQKRLQKMIWGTK